MCMAVKELEVVILPVTYRCNAKCAMCGIGELKKWCELSLKNYEAVFKDPIWSSNVRSVNITGGEPFLRKDIVEMTEMLLDNTKNLNSLIVNTNGILSDNIVDYVKRVLSMCKREHNVSLKIYVSLDGIGKSHDDIRKVNHCFEKVDQTVRDLRQLMQLCDFDVVLNCTVTKENYQNVYDVYEYARNHKMEINYTYAMISSVYFQNEEKVVDLDNLEREYFINFLNFLIETDMGVKMSGYYRNLIKMLEGSYRRIGCIFQEKGIFIHPSGKVFRCWVYDKEIGNIHKDTLSEIWEKQVEKCSVEDIKQRCQSCFNNCYQEYQRLTTIEKMFKTK